MKRGRHHHGKPVVRVPPRTWDPAQQAIARRLNATEPEWLIWYGTWSRHFYAAPLHPTPSTPVLQARTADELHELLREAESPRPADEQHEPLREAEIRRPAHDQHELLREAASLRPADEFHGRRREAETPRPVDPPTPGRGSINPQRPATAVPLPPEGASMIETPSGLRTVCWDLPDDLAMIGKTRRLVGVVLAGWGLADLADDAILVVGELLANAVTYGEPPIRLSLWAAPDRFCIRVTDHGPDQPRRLDLGLDAVHGRGLSIVAALAHENGVTRPATGPGKTLWACWRLPTYNPTRTPTNT
ncbi:hypothetical protein Sru01_63590 [Sphaerisporangium rufum]|uniref:Histidine kinase/HSP90-like ATPase domain-containing protein n=2 Tax=Sphaerisporangium rufum TaxID=1381558 RepID=A0A919R826_9ACTN|nr:hypothetical protein Sru01_63590 [Sphaerisporangium rufum]